MLTRGQVAKQLGVSIAAVRRFEGKNLRPVMRGGQWLFDPDEVEELADLRARGGGRLALPSDNSDESIKELRARLDEIDNQVQAQGGHIGKGSPHPQDAQQSDKQVKRCLGELLRETLQQRQDVQQREEQAQRELAESEDAKRDAEIANGRAELLRTFGSLSTRQRRHFLRDNPEFRDLREIKRALTFDERLYLAQVKFDELDDRVNGESSNVTAKVLVTGAAVVGVGALAIYAYNKWVRTSGSAALNPSSQPQAHVTKNEAPSQSQIVPRPSPQ